MSEADSKALAAATRVAVEAEALLDSLGEYVRQSMTLNPEWSRGVVGLEAAILDFRRLVPPKSYHPDPLKVGDVVPGGYRVTHVTDEDPPRITAERIDEGGPG